MLQKIVYAGANSPSFRRASNDLRVLAEVTVAVKRVERLTQRIGQQRQQQRDAATAAYQARPLTQREEPPAQTTPPSVAVVEMDGGRLQIRAARDEAEPTPAAVPVADPQPPPPVLGQASDHNFSAGKAAFSLGHLAPYTVG